MLACFTVVKTIFHAFCQIAAPSFSSPCMASAGGHSLTGRTMVSGKVLSSSMPGLSTQEKKEEGVNRKTSPQILLIFGKLHSFLGIHWWNRKKNLMERTDSIWRKISEADVECSKAYTGFAQICMMSCFANSIIRKKIIIGCPF